MSNSVDPDQTPRSGSSDLGLHSLFKIVSLNTNGKYVTLKFCPIFQLKVSQFLTDNNSDLFEILGKRIILNG